MMKLESLMKHIVELYFVSLKNIKNQSFDSSDDCFSPYLKYYSDVEEAFLKLSKEKRRIINKEFFYDDYKNWWIKEYSPLRFKHLKKLAIKDFVEAFYEIH